MGLPPTGKCVVVVRTGVGDEFSDKVVREEGRVWVRLISELHHRHPGKPEPAHQLAHTIRDDAEVLRDDGKAAQPIAHPAEEMLARSIEPLPVDGRRDRKSTRLNSSHVAISYAVFC